MKIYSLLKNTLSVKAYPDTVPEGVDIPAVSYVNVAYTSGRSMDGTKTRKSESWRITVVAETFTDLNTIIGELEELDNTSQYGFATIYSELVLVEAKEEDAIYRRAFIDLTLY